MKRITSTIVGVLVYCAIAQATLSQKQFVIHFPSDSSTLDAAALVELDQAIAYANTTSYFEVLLDAHTDNDGTNQYNIELSKNRAVSVRSYIVSKGIDEKLIRVNWFGEVKPVKSNTTDKGKQENRRVTVNINGYAWDSAGDILQDISNERQEFIVDAHKPATIVSDGGVKIEIPANAFVAADGTPVKAKEVTITLDEALSKQSWVTEGLSTISPEGILESGGMFKIEALLNGEQLALKEGMQIDVQVPFLKPTDDMGLFYASTDTNGNMTWQQSQQAVQQKTNVELPVLKVDSAKLDALIKKYSAMKTDYIQADAAFYSLKPAPQFKLSEPRKPRQPDRKTIRVPGSMMKTVFMTKKRENELIDAAYQKKMQDYEKSLALYNKRLAYYNVQKKSYDEKMEAFKRNKPEYDMLINKAINTIDSLQAEYNQNLAYERLHRSLCALKYKLSKGDITDPAYIGELIDTYADDWYYSSNFRPKTPYPDEVANIRKKLAELGFPKPDKSVDYYNYQVGYRFRSVWSSDEQLMSLLNESQRKLMADRFSKGLGTSNQLSGYYLTSLNGMGWCNLDKFSKLPLTATLEVKSEPNSQVYVVFENMNSVVTYYGQSMSVPSNASMTVFSVMLKDNMPYYAVARVNSKTKVNTVELKYQPGLLQDIKAAIKEVV